MGRLRTIVFGSLVTGSLIMTAGPAVADWRDIRNDRQRLRMDSQELDQNRSQLDWDLDHGASSFQIDRDRRVIQNSLDNVRRDREILRQDQRDLEDLQ